MESEMSLERLYGLRSRIVISPGGERVFEEWARGGPEEGDRAPDLMVLLGLLYGEGRALPVGRAVDECWNAGVVFQAEYHLVAGPKGLVGIYPVDEFCPPGFVYEEFRSLVDGMPGGGEGGYRWWSRRGRMLDVLREHGLA